MNTEDLKQQFMTYTFSLSGVRMFTEYGTKDEIRKEALVCVEEGKSDRVLVEHGVVAGMHACEGRRA